MYALLQLIATVIDLYIAVIIIYVILTWLVALNVVNTRNRAVHVIGDALYRLTEPVMRPVRRVIPAVGGFDLSPLIVCLLLIFIRNLLLVDIGRAVM